MKGILFPWLSSLCRTALYKVIRLSVLICCLFYLSIRINGMLVHRTWTTRNDCVQIENPYWPFAYQKTSLQAHEFKGRVTSNSQDMRHQCQNYGVHSKCHICEDIKCGINLDCNCSYQIQGVDWNELPKNIPTVTDVPWSVGGLHRYDYEGGSHVCVFLSGGNCIIPSTTNYTSCSIRCWGANSGNIFTSLHPGKVNEKKLPRGDADAIDSWSYPKNYSTDGSPQGWMKTLAGSGEKGYLDGSLETAKFSNPQDVAVGDDGMLYIADTDNHCIRKIDLETKQVVKIAGCNGEGFKDGPALDSTFSFPSGITYYKDGNGIESLFVADTGNHRIRRIQSGQVECYAGRCGSGTESETVSKEQAGPQPGFADGSAAVSRFRSPQGIAVDLTNGIVFVADTGNHLIRQIGTDRITRVIAGKLEKAEPYPGCLSPCFKGVKGFQDGDLTQACFSHPTDIDIGLEKTVLVTDDNRIRRISYSGDISEIQGIQSRNRVVTVVGSERQGLLDGQDGEALLNQPSAIATDNSGRIYIASPISCKIRRVSPASMLANNISCSTRVSDIVKPAGCSSYQASVDALNMKSTCASKNIFYNYASRMKKDPIYGLGYICREEKACVGTPPKDGLLHGNKSIPTTDKNGDILSDLVENTEVGTTIKVSCPVGCVDENIQEVYGTNVYDDSSAICGAAIHQGLINNSGGYLIITLEHEKKRWNSSFLLGSENNGIISKDISESQGSRIFSLQIYHQSISEIQTIAGKSMASLSESCGYLDAQPPQESLLNSPQGLALFSNSTLSDTNYLYIADAGNNRIRMMTSTCSKICENGGKCIAPETCLCAHGWLGDDCTIPQCDTECDDKNLCVAPNTCSCRPGYIGDSCDEPTCVQVCENGGSCTAPDTCQCERGWFDSNCTTPVCDQTCGNGGNCTAPNTCTCPSDWEGNDCRTPVCSQTCQNNGYCIAPHTCLCPNGWSGHDCSLPVCSQGYFVADPSTYAGAKNRPWTWDTYVPCNYQTWCTETNNFDCLQMHRTHESANIPWGKQYRMETGHKNKPNICTEMELRADANTNFIYRKETNETTGWYRYSPQTPYGWEAIGYPWHPIRSDSINHTPPWTWDSDRQIALVERRKITQGVYVCANQGNCVAPEICQCAEGWAGFDCRTPICSQGYYVPDQLRFIASDPPEAAHPRHPVSNPPFIIHEERLTATSVFTSEIEYGDQRYLSIQHTYQGGYSCSIRSLTQFEKPETTGPYASPENYDQHVNYYSRYMDSRISDDGHYYTHWTNMYWEPLYSLSSPLLDNAQYGWQRGGVWSLIPNRKWIKGKCLVEFQRICGDINKAFNLKTLTFNEITTDTDLAYRTRMILSNVRDNSLGRWSVHGGECVDHVIRGCYNNGTCVAPNLCQCAPGWSGNDCSIPVCSKITCSNNGRCTHPDICTCEKGWRGPECTIPMCAQECKNDGICIAPDTCKCKTWPSTWRDGREGGGRPIYRQTNGDPQHTGWTGYDCNTPICTQAEKFLYNTDNQSPNYIALRGHGKDGTLTCSAERCPQFDQEVVSNDGKSFQSGCSIGNPIPNIPSTLTREQQIVNLRNNLDILNINRTSDKYLCGVDKWEQGDYTIGRTIRQNYPGYKSLDSETWIQQVVPEGEGIYACYNKGSCVSPDVCSCGDGFSGFDCSQPSCRFRRPDESVVGCLHHGVCITKDRCECIQTPSILYTKFSLAPPGRTGWTGVDCSIAMCVQGFFDPQCKETTAGTEGCYRCPNDGKCVAPDYCECAPGWTGYDCTTPICEVEVTQEIKVQLFTVDEEKYHVFEKDPCGTYGGRWGKEWYQNNYLGQGNCTSPGLCTCLCRQRYDYDVCNDRGELCDEPWTDPLDRIIPHGYIHGSKRCYDGFQGLENENGLFMSCHLQIYIPSFYEKYTVSFVAILILALFILSYIWYKLRKKYKSRVLIKKQEKRRTKRESEEEALLRSNSFSG